MARELFAFTQEEKLRLRSRRIIPRDRLIPDHRGIESRRDGAFALSLEIYTPAFQQKIALNIGGLDLAAYSWA